MGALLEKYIPLQNVSKIITYNDGFRELIATEDIPAGTHLINSLDPSETRFERYLGTYMNDDDFRYPEKFTENKIRKSIQLYEKSNNNNCYQYDDYHMITTKNIKKGEALTKRYGLVRWFIWLCADVKNDNPFVINWRRKSNLYYGKYFLPKYNLNEKDQDDAIRLLIKIAKEFGYTLEFKKN